MLFRLSTRLAIVAGMFLSLSVPAWATWDGKVVLDGTNLQDVQSSTLSFTTDAGNSVPVTVEGEDDDDNVILILGFGGDSAQAGTLRTSGPMGSKSIRLPAAGPGQNIYVDTSGPGSASLTPPSGPAPGRVSTDWYFPTHQLGLDFGYRNLQGGDIATSGTVLPSGPGSEFPSLTADYDLDAVGGTVSYAYKLGGGLPGWMDWTGFSSNLTLGASYSRFTDDKDFRSEQPPGTDTGFLITSLNPAPNDTTGAFFGPAGIQSQANLDVDLDRFNVSLQWECDRPLPWGGFFKSNLDFRYSQWDVELESLDTFEPNFPSNDFFNHRVQNLDQEILDVGLGTTIINPIGDGTFDWFGGATARLYFSDADLDSTERFRIGGPSEETRIVNQSDDSTDLGLDLNIGAGWNINRNWRVTAEAKVLFNVPSATIDNPVRGDGSNPGSEPLQLSDVDYDNETLWGASLAVNYRF